MLPVIIEDYIKNLTNKAVHIERRQFYYTSLVKIKEAVEKAIRDYEIEKKNRK